jgi:hypothetical protein
VGSASYNPAPEGVQVCSLSHASMDVHVGSSPPRSDGATAVRASAVLTAGGAEVTPDSALQIIPADLPSSSHASVPPTLGLPLFLFNLQVSRPLALCCSY